MERNNGQTIFLSVIGIATLLVAIIGATFAYFTTTVYNNGATNDIRINAVKMATLTFNAPGMEFTTEGTTGSNLAILPGWSNTVNVTVVRNGASDVDVAYNCVLNVTENTFTNLAFSSTGTGADSAATLATGASSKTLATGTIQASTNSSENANFAYTISLPNKTTDQTAEDNGATFRATVSCSSTQASVYYWDGEGRTGSTATGA